LIELQVGIWRLLEVIELFVEALTDSQVGMRRLLEVVELLVNLRAAFVFLLEVLATLDVFIEAHLLDRLETLPARVECVSRLCVMCPLIL